VRLHTLLQIVLASHVSSFLSPSLPPFPHAHTYHRAQVPPICMAVIEPRFTGHGVEVLLATTEGDIVRVTQESITQMVADAWGDLRYVLAEAVSRRMGSGLTSAMRCPGGRRNSRRLALLAPWRSLLTARCWPSSLSQAFWSAFISIPPLPHLHPCPGPGGFPRDSSGCLFKHTRDPGPISRSVPRECHRMPGFLLRLMA